MIEGPSKRASNKGPSIRSSLLALMAVMALPVAVLSVALAAVIYSNSLQQIENSQALVASALSSRMMAWFRTAQNFHSSIVATAGGRGRLTSGECQRLLKDTLDSVEGYRALLIDSPSSPPCIAADSTLSEKDVLEYYHTIDQLPKFTRVNDVLISPVRLEPITISGQRTLALVASLKRANDTPINLFLLLAPGAQAFLNALTMVNRGQIAIIDKNGEVLFTNMHADLARSWPFLRNKLDRGLRLSASSPDDGANFARTAIPASDLQVIVRFDEAAHRAPWSLFLVLAITPIVLMAITYLVYARSIQKDVMYWIYGVKSAALERVLNPSSRSLARVGPSMPRELRQVAETFNKMVADIGAREESLRSALAENERLTRELHHRLKNSLQIIQSYLALSERASSEEMRNDYVETAVRVQVLSIAYRIALAGGKMDLVRLEEFCAEVASSLVSSFPKQVNFIKLQCQTEKRLSVDRAIPLGLALVEAALAGQKKGLERNIEIIISHNIDCEVFLEVWVRGIQAPDYPNPRILRGLALQLDAVSQPLREGQILNWRFFI